VSFEPGLTAEELTFVEREYGFCFPPDLRHFLGHALPVSKGWVNWRETSRPEILKRLDWPLDGICFDIEQNAFWLDSWGPKPGDLSEALAIARTAVRAAPRLIPVCSHRFLPDRPCKSGNPVFSVHQTDIIYYGANLFEYLCNEFAYYFGRERYTLGENIRRIEFWSELVG
jgi:hypothetical protein